MNVDLGYQLKWSSMVYVPDCDPKLQANRYRMSLQMRTCSDNRNELNIALERIKLFTQHMLTHTVFVRQDQTQAIQNLCELGANITVLPEEPLDQIIGIMLFCKLNAVMCQRMIITRLEVASRLGDRVYYTHDAGDNLGPFSNPGWWSEPSAHHGSGTHRAQHNKVSMIGSSGWAEWGLLWEVPTAEQQVVEPVANDNTVVYADFGKNDTEQI